MSSTKGLKSGHRSAEFKIDIGNHHDSANNIHRDPKKRNSFRDSLSDACQEGTTGSFTTVENDFTLHYFDKSSHTQRFKDEPHWTPQEREKAKKFRFVVATMALMGLLLCLTSRMVLNVGIVEMSKSDPDTLVNEPITTTSNYELKPETTTPGHHFDDTTITDKQNSDELVDSIVDGINEADVSIEVKVDDSNPSDPNKPHKIKWTPKRKNYLIGSFYMGYAPSMMLTGGLANKYGAWFPLFISVFISFLINAVTPLITSYSYNLLFLSRLVLGICQGCLMPAIYDIFNRWLTMTETSIFVPMLKVSFGIGSLLGSALPAVTKAAGYDWPYLFYETSFFCGIWSIAWFILATSTPQTNRFVEPNELHRIMRKKGKKPEPAIQMKEAPKENKSSITTIDRSNVDKLRELEHKKPEQEYKEEQEATPWLLIAFNRSVLGLAVTKFTYNMGADFICLQLPIYLDKIHKSPIETISQICSAGFLMQAVCSLGVGWLVKYSIQNKPFGLSKSKMRKIFQGFSNFGMSICYFILAFCSPSFTVIIILLEVVFFLWIFGAGGESIVAYDLSQKYPATITGFAHSIGITSSFVLPALCDFMLQQEETNNDRWESIFEMIGILCLIGGLVFVFIVRPKPFLPGEVEKK